MAISSSNGRRSGASRSLLRDYATFAGEAISRRRSDMRLNAARVEAELSSRAKSEFIAHMSHDLRTPLNAIIGFSELMMRMDAERLDPARLRGYATDINESGRHLLGIINDILDLAKIESGEIDIDIQPTDLRDVFHTTMAMSMPLAEAKSQSLTIHLEDGLPPVRLDARRTKQILVNLVSNAIKFSPRWGQIRIAAGREANDDVVISVSDNGPGMTAAELDVALSRFGRVRNAMTRQEEGSGLGLTIVRHLCQAQEAQFTLRSKPGEGTCASLRFPSRLVAYPFSERGPARAGRT